MVESSQNIAQAAISAGKYGWIGLGAMGKFMAGHVQNYAAKHNMAPLKVWNRTAARATEHAEKYKSCAITDLAEFSDCSIVILSLPTTNEVRDICEKLQLPKDSIIIDTTSGDPAATKEVSAKLQERNIHMVDCPVSGGPAGAEKGSVTTMLGGTKEIVDGLHDWLIDTFSGKAVNCGPIGSGMAVKAINNTLNMAHVLVATEGLCALRNYGVEPDIALDVINASSGRSLATEVRVPTEVLSGNFAFGFKLALMAKDCRIGASLMEENFPKATILKEVSRLSNEAEQKEYCKDGDYTTASKLLEEASGTNLQIAKKTE